MRRIPGVFWHRVLAPNSGWKVIHWIATAVLFWLAFLFLLPGETFATSHAYMHFASFGGEETWAIIFLSTAILGAVSGVTSDTRIRMLGCMILSMMHGVIAVLLLRGSPLSSGSGTYAIIAFATTLRLWRLVKVRSDDH